MGPALARHHRDGSNVGQGIEAAGFWVGAGIAVAGATGSVATAIAGAATLKIVLKRKHGRF